MSEIAKFEGFSKKTLKFYRDIKKNNSREWFEQHRDEYMEHVIAPAQSFIVDMGKELKKVSGGVNADPDYNGKGSFKRIFTDQRFVKDRDPYKTYMDIMFWEGPIKSKKDNSAFYLRVMPDKMWFFVGIKGFNTKVLKAYRNELTDGKRAAALQRAAKKVGDAGYDIGGENYKQMPRGFDIDEKYEKLSLHDGMFAFKEIKIPAEFESAKFIPFCLKHYKEMAPLHKWLVGMTEGM